MRRRRTDLPTAALVMELGETEGRSGPEISGMTGVPRSTVENILSGAHGWDRIAQTEVFKLYRQEQNKALEQASRTLAADALKKAAEKMDAASFYQLVTGAAILIDKSRLLAGDPTENVAHLHLHQFEVMESLVEKLRRIKNEGEMHAGSPEKSGFDSKAQSTKSG